MSAESLTNFRSLLTFASCVCTTPVTVIGCRSKAGLFVYFSAGLTRGHCHHRPCAIQCVRMQKQNWFQAKVSHGFITTTRDNVFEQNARYFPARGDNFQRCALQQGEKQVVKR